MKVVTLGSEMTALPAELESLATKESVHAEIDGLRIDISAFEARFIRRLWVVGASIVVATFTLLKLFP